MLHNRAMAMRSVAEAAERLGITTVSVYQAIKRKELSAVDVDIFGGKTVKGVSDREIARYAKILSSRPRRGPKRNGEPDGTKTKSDR